MWRNAKLLLVILSVAVNLAFVSAWLTQTAMLRGAPTQANIVEPFNPLVHCPLHRQLGITDEQWSELEPRLKEFRQSSRALAGEIQQSRREMLDLLAAARPDREAIAAKQEEILAGQRKMQHLVIEQILAEKTLLTPTQQQRLFNLIRSETKDTEACPMMGLGQGPGKGPGAVLRKAVESASEQP